ncbi:IS200/IS605 family transposase [Anaerohalosphaeraceae bacterium U12dextr]
MSYASIYYHIIFAIKDRTAGLSEDQVKRTCEYLAGIIRNMKAKLYILNGVCDHFHMLVSLHPELSVSEFVRVIKTNSSRWFRDTFDNHFGWQDGYSVFSVSYSGVQPVTEYIRNQGEHHRTRTFKEELELFFKKHNIRYDERYI